MKERKLGLAKRLSAFALAFVMVFSLLATFNVSALAADDLEPTLNPGWTYDGESHDLILYRGEPEDDDYNMYYCLAEDEDDEPLAPTKTNMGDWTRNWRDDEQFVATNAGEYYVWYCTFNEEENEVGTEPELAGIVEVEKATVPSVAPVGNSRTVPYDEIAAHVNLLSDNTGVVFHDYALAGQYKFMVTGTDTTSVTEDQLEASDDTTYVDEAGKYRVWYQLQVTDLGEANFENSDIDYVDVTITEGKGALVVDPEATAQTWTYTGNPIQIDGIDADEVYDGSDGTVVDGATVMYGLKRSEIIYTSVDEIKDVAEAAGKADPTSTTKAGSSVTLYYTVSAEGYEDTTGAMTLSITKAQATVDDAELTDTSAAPENAIEVDADADDGYLFAQATISTSKPSASSNKWLDDLEGDMHTGVVDITEQLTPNKINYIYYMAKSADSKNITDSEVGYFTAYATVNGDGEWTLTEIPEGAATTTLPIAANGLKYSGAKQPLLTTPATITGATGATVSVQYNVQYTSFRALATGANYDTMPAASDAGWFTATTTSADKLCGSAVGAYVVWWRYNVTIGGKTYQTTPQTFDEGGFVAPVMIAQAPVVVNNEYIDGIEPPEANGPFQWTGKNYNLFDAGKAKTGMTWLYMTMNPDGDIINIGPTVTKASDKGIYTTVAILVDTTYNYATNDGYAPYTRMVNYKGTKGQVVNVVPVESTIDEADLTSVVDPTVTKNELVYDGTSQSLLATAGSTRIGNLYQVVLDADGNLVSFDGTASDAGDYTVGCLVTDLGLLELYMAETLYGWDGVQGLIAAGLVNPNVWSYTESVGTVEIEKATPTVTGVEALSQEVTGYDIDIVSYGETDGGQIYYKAVDSDNEVIFSEADGWRIVPMAKEMGEYTISYRVAGDKNFKDLDWVTLTDKAQIAAGKAEVTTAPVGLGYNANGDALVLATAGVAEDGHMEYALGTVLEPVTDWSDEIPTATDEATYYVWYKAKGNEGYADSDKDFVVATIGHERELYRIYNPANGEHIYTYDANEVAYNIQNFGWTKDGSVTGTSAGTEPMYRLGNLVNGAHMYSNDQNEIDTLVASGAWNLEGIAFTTVPKGEGTQDYYRLSDPTGTLPHHYTADQNEIATLVAAGIYNLDGYIWSFPGTSN